MKHALLACATIAALVGSACSGSPAGPGPSPTISAQVAGIDAGAVVGVPVQLTVVVTGAEAPAAGQVFWTTSDSAIATIDGNGLLTPLKNGTVTVGALHNGVSAAATVNVYPNLAGRWRLTMPLDPEALKLTPGGTFERNATVTQQAGTLTGTLSTSGAMSGTVSVAGEVQVTSRSCGKSWDQDFYTLMETRGWQMRFDPTRGVYEGSLENRVLTFADSACSGTPLSVRAHQKWVVLKVTR